MDVYSIKTAADGIGRSVQFVRRAVELKKFKAEKIGNRWLIPGEEVRLFQANPFQISGKEMMV